MDEEAEAERIALWLREHPDFLAERPDLLAELTPPGRWSGKEGVVDMQQFMLAQLKRESEGLRDAARHVIETSRANMAVQTRVHTAVLILLSARNVDDVARMIHNDLRLPLDVDAAVLAFEEGEAPPAIDLSDYVLRVPIGTADRVLGPDKDAGLFPRFVDSPGLFGSEGYAVRSAAVARVRVDSGGPVGMLALGSRGGGTFDPSQGAELLTFLARTTESLIRRFLEEEE